MMQGVAQEQEVLETETPIREMMYPTGQMVITVELVAIIALVVMSFAIRVLALDSVPIAETETQQALSAWRSVKAGVPGEAIISDSPMVFWSQALSFELFGGGEISARILTAVGGVLLTMTPFLFRRLLGSSRAYLLAVLLTFSPVVVAASRFSTGTVWAMVFAAIGLWAVWRFWDSEGETAFGFVGMGAFGGMIFLSGPNGTVLGVILAIAGALALYLMALNAPDEADLPGNDFLVMVRERFQGWPWFWGSGLAALVVIGVSTGFLLNFGGLSMVAAGLGGFLNGFFNGVEGQPILYTLLVSLFYETWLWVLAIATIVFVIRRNQITFTEIFLLSWVIVAGFASMIYQGGGAEGALWVVIPLAALATYIINDSLQAMDDSSVIWLGDFINDEQQRELAWGKWILAFLMFALLVMAGLHFQVVGRGILSVPNGSLTEIVNRFDEAGFANVARSFVWLIISVFFIGIGYFLAASIWGDLMTIRGMVLGTFAFVVMSGVATSWNVSVANADDPTELWHIHATSQDTTLLRQTLLELSNRETLGFPQLEVAAVADDDGIIAWQLRDFERARFVDDISQARSAEVIIAPETAEPPDLGGSYVGQSFLITQDWPMTSMQGFDFLAWWSVREARFQPVAEQVVVLWVRQDIFDSNPFEPSL